MAVSEIVIPDSAPYTGEKIPKLAAGFQAEMLQEKTSVAMHEKVIGGGTHGGYRRREAGVTHDGEAIYRGILAENGQMLYYGPAYGFPYQPTCLLPAANPGPGANDHGHHYVHYYQQPLYSDTHYYPADKNVLKADIDKVNSNDSVASQKAKFGSNSNLEYQENLLKPFDQYGVYPGVGDGNYYGSRSAFDHYHQQWHFAAQGFFTTAAHQSFLSVPNGGVRQFQNLSRVPFVSSHSNRFSKGTGRSWRAKETKKNLNKVEATPDNVAVETSVDQTHRPLIEKARLILVPDCCEVLDQLKIMRNNEDGSVCRADYNKENFQVSYESAKFFVIKSYSEDDVHKSIKYGVWSSTPCGNKRLNEAYHKAQEKALSSSSPVPVFLFFSVNCSGQFCGVAEMMGMVDFTKNMDFWLQGKWDGCIPLKWHIIKDVPNGQFRHIILSNNDNRPVTHSRDAQEIYFHQGLEMLKIFKLFPMKTSLLDDFAFYDDRQKVLQERKVKQQQRPQFVKHIAAGAPDENASRTQSLLKHEYENGIVTKGEGDVKVEDIQCQVAAMKVDGGSKTSECRGKNCAHNI